MIVVSVLPSNRQLVVIMSASGMPRLTMLQIPVIRAVFFVVRAVSVVRMRKPGPVPGMFSVCGDTAFDDMPMLTCVSVMHAASENRMQQHRRHRQNAGQELNHEVFTAFRALSQRQV